MPKLDLIQFAHLLIDKVYWMYISDSTGKSLNVDPVSALEGGFIEAPTCRVNDSLKQSYF
jgi:hypothetical protein